MKKQLQKRRHRMLVALYERDKDHEQSGKQRKLPSKGERKASGRLKQLTSIFLNG